MDNHKRIYRIYKRRRPAGQEAPRKRARTQRSFEPQRSSEVQARGGNFVFNVVNDYTREALWSLEHVTRVLDPYYGAKQRID